MQNIWNFMVGKLSLQEIATLAIIREISDSKLETGRYGPKSGVSRIIRESWQQCSPFTDSCLNLSTRATFFCPQGGRCREFQL